MMSAHMQYTPGPWGYFTDSKNMSIRESEEMHMKFLVGSDGQGFCHTVGLNEPTDSGNAKLISMAPCMYEALLKLSDPEAPRNYTIAEMQEIARNAINRTDYLPTRES